MSTIPVSERESVSEKPKEDNKAKMENLTVGVANLDPSSENQLESPPGLTLTSTTSTVSSLTPKTPKDQPIRQKLTSEDRKTLALDFIAKKELDIVYKDLDYEGKLRCKRLMSPDFSYSPNQEKVGGNHDETTFQEQFAKFCTKSCQGWGWDDEDLSLVFFDRNAAENYLVIRLQRSGTCYMHAAVVYLHYLQYVRTNQTGANHEMLDVSWYIRERFPKERLENFLQFGGGGSATKMFCEITGTASDLVESWPIPKKSKNAEDFDATLGIITRKFQRSREPCLVSKFAVEQDFKTTDKFVYDGEIDKQKFLEYGKANGKPKGVRVLHSMVLLGLKVETDKVWFLLQNFWRGKYFVVVSGEYLASCGATVTFVDQEAKLTLNESCHMTDAYYAETETSPEEEAEPDDWYEES